MVIVKLAVSYTAMKHFSADDMSSIIHAVKH